MQIITLISESVNDCRNWKLEITIIPKSLQ
jgi:hypothetical protein